MEKLYRKKESWISCGDLPRTIIHIIMSSLSGEDCETGALEGAQATANNNSQALGKLIQILYERNLLDLNDVSEIAEIYGGLEEVEN